MKKLLLLLLLFPTSALAHDQALSAALDAMLVNPTHTAAPGANLPWSQPSTWLFGAVPDAGSKVLIPVGSTVTLDASTPALKWLRIEGKLTLGSVCACAPGATVQTPINLRVETLHVNETGTFEAGTAAAPITEPFTISIPDGTLDPVWDPNALARGVISEGTLKLYGAPVTSWALTANGAAIGSTVIALQTPVVGWRSGDRVVIPGTSLPWMLDDDENTISSVAPDGLSVTLTTPLRFGHLPNAEGRAIPIGNLTRRITLKSEVATPFSKRGHFMMMTAPEVAYVGTRDMGRTNKKAPVTDPPNLGNTRGRYSWHMHRLGIGAADPVVTLMGNAVDGDPGWAFVNHSGKIKFQDSVAYKVVGAAFTSETGDELGSFDRNLAIRQEGTGAIPNPSDDRGIGDFGWSGHGFWTQGGGVTLDGNICTGAAAGCIVHFAGDFHLPGQPYVQFPTANLPAPPVPPSWGTVPFIHPGSVPTVSKNNMIFGSQDGLVVWAMGSTPGGARHSVPGISLYSDSYIECNRTCVSQGYVSWQHYLRLKIRPRPGAWHQIAVSNSGVNTGVRYEALDIRGYPNGNGGFAVGILDPTNHESWIEGNTIQAHTGVLMMNSYQEVGRNVQITGNTFLPFPPAGVQPACNSGYRAPTGDCGQKDVSFTWNMVFSSLYYGPGGAGEYYWTQAFNMDNNLDVGGDKTFFNGNRLYMVEYDPTRTSQKLTSIPEFIRKRPNGTWRTVPEIRTELGLYLGGVITPTDTFTVPNVLGLLSPTAREILPPLNEAPNNDYYFYQVTHTCSNFTLKVKDVPGNLVTSGPHQLSPGWNFPRIDVDGITGRAVPVYCDTAVPPTRPLRGW